MSIAVEALIPHRPPMRWIDSLIDCTDTTATATAFFGAEHFAVADGKVSEAALVECVAQTVAAALGQRARMRGHSANAGIGNTGMLAAVSNFKIHSPTPVEKPLRIEVREVKRFGPMLLVAGSILCEGHAIASGELTLYA
jgi:predicted hotdog family 3-hydroxylacyl-ACP dehydratase